MSRDTKILAASGLLGVVVAIGKSGAKTPDQILETTKAEMFPLIVNLVGLGLLLKFIK
jgi:hypothetical protein